MKKIVSYITLCSFIAVSLLSSCKKSDSEITKPYMEGEVEFDFPAFIGRLQNVTVTASGITKPDEVTYKWISSSMFSDTLVATTITVCTPDTLGEFAIVGYAFAEGYYASYTTKTFNTVDPAKGGSLKGLPVAQDIFTDERDGKTYDVVSAGSLQWFAQNLGWNGAGRSFHDSPVMDVVVGRLYSWNEATGGETGSGLAGGPQGACPQGVERPHKGGLGRPGHGRDRFCAGIRGGFLKGGGYSVGRHIFQRQRDVEHLQKESPFQQHRVECIADGLLRRVAGFLQIRQLCLLLEFVFGPRFGQGILQIYLLQY